MANPYFDEKVPDVVLKSLFSKYDLDNSRHLGKSELLTLLKDDLGLTDEQSNLYTHLLDKDGDAKISIEEFLSWFRSGEKFKSINDTSRFYAMNKAVEMFNKYDTDGSGVINIHEYEKLYLELGGKPENLKQAFDALDRDKNGKIVFKEFLTWLNWVPLD